METWKPIPGFDNYEVSDFGRVRNKRGRVLKPQWHANGHSKALAKYYGISVSHVKNIKTKRSWSWLNGQ